MVYSRSFLFVPAESSKHFQSALNKDCDCVILDLEDATHPSRKEAARAVVPEKLKELKRVGKKSAVRINADLRNSVSDLQSVVSQDLDIVVLPKVEHPRDVKVLAQLVSNLESERGVEEGKIKFLLLIESPQALLFLNEIACAHPRIMGMMLGSEDFSLECGVLPTKEVLTNPSLQVLYASKAAGIQAIGFIGSIANIGDVDEFRLTVEHAKSLGFQGAIVVHPKFLNSINECYKTSQEELDKAKEIIETFEKASDNGVGAFKLGDQMIDKPIYLRAKRLVSECSIN
jgi:citrate lyase subunit beta/citryl-CoA lyase